ncbi:hypothetical protein [Acinetobacter sp.]|uniref:hypothetical protein n=1 Tax=Acinetobacter sp. TaxID=472 RepID=UPI003BB21B5E
MKHEEFKKVVESLPSYQRLSFIHGERLFIRDADGYRIVSIQALYELASRPVGMIVTAEILTKEQREKLLTELVEIDTTALGDGEPKSIIVPLTKPSAPTSFAAGGLIPVPPLVPCPLLDLKYSGINDHDDALTDGQVWVAIGIMILIILIISFCAFPSP